MVLICKCFPRGVISSFSFKYNHFPNLKQISVDFVYALFSLATLRFVLYNEGGAISTTVFPLIEQCDLLAKPFPCAHCSHNRLVLPAR